MHNNVEATGPNSGEPPKSKFRNKAERNKGYQTEATQIFGKSEMLLGRPEGMNREEFRALRKIQSTVLKRLFHKGHSPSRKLQGILGGKEPLARTKKGRIRVAKRMINQRKSG